MYNVSIKEVRVKNKKTFVGLTENLIGYLWDRLWGRIVAMIFVLWLVLGSVLLLYFYAETGHTWMAVSGIFPVAFVVIVFYGGYTYDLIFNP